MGNVTWISMFSVGTLMAALRFGGVPAPDTSDFPPANVQLVDSKEPASQSAMRPAETVRTTSGLTGRPLEDERSLPTEASLEALPTRAVVAFGARCARRILPMYQVAWPTAPAEMVEQMDEAVRCAENAPKTPFGELAEAFQNAPRAANAAVYHFGMNGQRLPAKEVAMAVGRAVAAALNEPLNDPALEVSAVLDAIHHATADLESSDRRRILDAINNDFDLVRADVLRDGTREGKEVRAELFGALWPAGAPSGWKVIQRNDRRAEATGNP